MKFNHLYLCVMCNDIWINRLTVLVFLYLSASFDSVDHDIFLKWLGNWVGPSGTVIGWLESHLKNRGIFVSIGSFLSEKTEIIFGVPQGSVLRPLLINIDMVPLSLIITSNMISNDTYADDTPLYIAMLPGDFELIQTLSE